MEPAMLDVEPLQQAMERNDIGGVRAYLDALPQRTANELLRVFGERWGFQTVEVAGVRYMLASALAHGLYRTADTSPLVRLLGRYGERLSTFGCFDHDGRNSLRAALHLSPKAGRAMFATWSHFLLATMQGQTPMAREMQRYLRHAEEQFRVNAAAEHETGLSVQQLQAREAWLRAREFANRALAVEMQINAHFGIPPHLSLMEAVKSVRQACGLDLSERLALSPHADDLAADDLFLEVTPLSERFGFPRRVLNLWLAQQGLQARQGDGTWQMTARAEDGRLAFRHQAHKGDWSGYNLKWRVAFIEAHAADIRRFGELV